MSSSEWISQEGLNILAQIDELRENNGLNKDEKIKPLSKIDIERLPLLPDKWSWLTSNDISTFITNGVHSPTKITDDLGIGIRMLRITDINDNRSIEFEKLPYCARFTKLDYFKTISKNDIYISFSGNVLGKRYLVRESRNDVVFAHYFVRIQPIVVEPKFIYYVLLSYHFERFMHEHTLGSAQPNLKVTDLKRIPLPIPPLNEQKVIADTLSALDDKIELNNKISKNLEEMAQAIFKSWFVDFEPFKDEEFEDSELGRIPKGWRVGKAEEFFDISIGKTPPRKEPQWFTTNKQDVKWVSISDMGNCGTYIFNSSECLTREAIEKYNVKIVPENTIILSFKLTVGRVAITNEKMATNEAIAHFKTNKDDINEFLYYYLKNFNYDKLGNTSSIASAVNSKVIKAMLLLMPDDDVLMQFHRLTMIMMNEIRKRQEENQIIKDIRDTLLPKLMSGEVRVPVEEVSA